MFDTQYSVLAITIKQAKEREVDKFRNNTKNSNIFQSQVKIILY